MTKTCRVCGVSKPTFEFYLKKDTKSRRYYIHARCICCERRTQAEYRKANREKILAQKREANRRNPFPNRERARRWLQNNRNRFNAAARRRAASPEARKKKHEYYLKTRRRHLEQNRNRSRRRARQDPGYRISMRLRTRIYNAIRGRCPKAAGSVALLGASIPDIRAHLEAQFKPGMSWDNYGKGGWHVDHIRPCASFDLTKPEEQRACFHYSNLQPLWWHENLRKSANWHGRSFNSP